MKRRSKGRTMKEGGCPNRRQGEISRKRGRFTRCIATELDREKDRKTHTEVGELGIDVGEREPRRCEGVTLMWPWPVMFMPVRERSVEAETVRSFIAGAPNPGCAGGERDGADATLERSSASGCNRAAGWDDGGDADEDDADTGRGDEEVCRPVRPAWPCAAGGDGCASDLDAMLGSGPEDAGVAFGDMDNGRVVAYRRRCR